MGGKLLTIGSKDGRGLTMANELKNTRNKNVTENLIKQIQIGVISDLDVPNHMQKKHNDWWEKNKDLVIGMTVEELTKILNSARNEQRLMKRYEEVVAVMSWQERIKFLKEGVDKLRKCNNRNFQTAIFITNLMEVTKTLLPIILMAL